MLVDALFAYYIIKVNQGQALPAATTGAVMYLLLAGGVLAYTANPVNLAAVFIGSFIGTYLVVKRQQQHLAE